MRMISTPVLMALRERKYDLRKRKEESGTFSDVAARYEASLSAGRLLTNEMKLQKMPAFGWGNAVAVAEQSSRIGSRAEN